MAEFIGHERLFRTSDGAFLLYMSTKGEVKAEERIIMLTVSDAISWLNEAPDQFGSLWEFAEVTPSCSARRLHRSQRPRYQEEDINGEIATESR
jgi:hypothetical protein